MKISIVIPTFNAAQHLAATLRSVVSQGFEDYEILIADGGSSDQTIMIAEATAPGKVTVVSRDDRGQLDAVIKALKAAKGEILYWLNADDIVMPGSFHHVAKIFSEMPTVDFVFSDDFAFDEARKSLFVGPTIRFLKRAEHELFYRQLYSECVFFRRRVFDGAEWANLNLRVYTDYEFFVNTFYNRRGYWTDKRLGAFRIVEGQASQKFAMQKRFEYQDVKARFFSRIHKCAANRVAEKLMIWPRFFVLNLIWPVVESGLRYFGRKLSGDRHRRLQADIFFSWISATSDLSKKNEHNPRSSVELQRILHR